MGSTNGKGNTTKGSRSKAHSAATTGLSEDSETNATVGDSPETPQPTTTPLIAKILAGGILYSDAQGFRGKIATLRASFSPVGIYEELALERLLQAVARMRKAALAEQDNAFDEKILRYENAAEKSLIHAVDVLEKGAAERAASGVEPAAVEDDAFPIRPSQLSADGEGLDPEAVPAVEKDALAGSGRWRERLMFDPNVSESSPVVRGTWVTADHIVSLVIDGWTWADLLRSHPELVEEDIRACLAYNVEEENHEFPS